jgi:3-(3-hydroxy-phenyl)propionate hydroxylase
MTDIPFFSVVIAGAGPTGLAMGNLLGMYGIDALILEQNAGLSDCPKAISIDDEGLRVCQAMGLHHPIIEHLLYDVEAQYLSGQRLLASIAPTSRRNGFPLISTFLQPDFEAILLNGLKRFPCITLQFQHTVESFEQSDASVIITARAPDGSRQRIESAYLLACDGGKSAIRRTLAIPMRGSTYPQRWLVIDSIDDIANSNVITFYCNPRRPAVSVPAPQQAHRWEFMLLPGEQGADMLQEERVRALIRSVAGLPEPHITRKIIYTFHALNAATYAKGRVFLLGDAAHLMPPFGGQGMNCGLRDAHNLAWKLQLVLQGLASPKLLNTYTLERRAHTAQMIGFSQFLGNIVMTCSRPLAIARDSILHTLIAIPAIHEYLNEMRVKPQPRYKQGFFLASRTRVSRRLAGMMLPQPEITIADSSRQLLDAALGPTFALLSLYSNDDPQQAFAGLRHETRDLLQRLGTRLVAIRQGEADLHNLPLRDPDLLVLVRPDRYIYGVFREGNQEAFTNTLRKHLSTL